MAYFGSIIITNKFGWTKTIEIKKALLLVGKNQSNDIVLSEAQGAGVAPLHLQLVCPKTGESSFRLINLSDTLHTFIDGPSNGIQLKPLSTLEIQNGDVLALGEFTLIFNLQSITGFCVERRSANLGIKLELPGVDLHTDKKLSGVLTLTNYGSTRRCQFTIEVNGLPSECFQVSPAPLLYPGASGEVQISFIHRGSRPPAGKQMVSICASASQAYPLEEIRLPLDLMVEPLYKFVLEFENPTAQKAANPSLDLVETPPAEVDFAPAQAAGFGSVSRLSFDNAVQYEGEKPPVSPLQTSEGDVLPITESAMTAPTQKPTEPIVQTETTLEDEPNWWADPPVVKSTARQTDPLSGSRKDIRRMLAGRDIHVIKAGEEIEEDTTADSKIQDGGAV